MAKLKNYTEARLSELIELALSDKVSFTAIEPNLGLEIEVKNLMRKNLKPKSYQLGEKEFFGKESNISLEYCMV